MATTFPFPPIRASWTLWWVTYRTPEGPRAKFYQATGEEAARAAATADGLVVEKADPLPYRPGFCYTPEECAGRTCCPKRPACSE